MPARIWLLIILLSFMFLQVSCTVNNDNISSGIEETQKDSAQKDISKEKETINQENENNKNYKDEDNMFNEIEPSPKGNFVLGEYVSPDENYKIKVWAWSGEKRDQLMADFVFYDYNKMTAKKFLRQTLIQNRRSNRRESVKWLDKNRALVNGYNLFEVNKEELLNLKPSDNFELIDYHVNDSFSALALIGTEHEQMYEVFMIDLDTLYILPIDLFTVQNNWFPEDKLRVAWGPDNILYFEADFNGRPAIYNFNALTNTVELCLIDAALISIDQKNKEISYLEIIRDESLDFVEKRVDMNYIIQNSDPHKIIQAAQTYMNETNRPVGQDINKYILHIKDITDEKAVVAFGPWASEYSGKIVLKKQKNNWFVDFEKYNHFFNLENLQDAFKPVKDKTGYVFKDEPDNYVIGSPYEDEDTVVFLVGLYGEPWEKEFILKKYNGTWHITEEYYLPGDPMLANNVNSPINAVKIFLDSIKNKQYLKLNDVTINTSDFEHHEKYMKNYLFIDDKVKVNNYYVGEARLLNDKINSIVQFWIINDEKSEYGWLKCRKVNGEWKIYKNI